jgi:hypothetical protein
MIVAFLPLSDFKMIGLPDPAPPSLAFEMGVVLALMALFALAFLIPQIWRLARPLPKPTLDHWLLIDGSNVMHWEDNTPKLESVRKVIDHLKRLGYVPNVVFDANAGWKLFDRYMHDYDFAKLLQIEPRQVLVVPKGTQADPYLLQTAREFGVRIITNDRFRDWSADYPEVTQPGFLISGRLGGAEVWLTGLKPVDPSPPQD